MRLAATEEELAGLKVENKDLSNKVDALAEQIKMKDAETSADTVQRELRDAVEERRMMDEHVALLWTFMEVTLTNDAAQADAAKTVADSSRAYHKSLQPTTLDAVAGFVDILGGLKSLAQAGAGVYKLLSKGEGVAEVVTTTGDVVSAMTAKEPGTLMKAVSATGAGIDAATGVKGIATGGAATKPQDQSSLEGVLSSLEGHINTVAAGVRGMQAAHVDVELMQAAQASKKMGNHLCDALHALPGAKESPRFVKLVTETKREAQLQISAVTQHAARAKVFMTLVKARTLGAGGAFRQGSSGRRLLERLVDDAATRQCARLIVIPFLEVDPAGNEKTRHDYFLDMGSKRGNERILTEVPTDGHDIMEAVRSIAKGAVKIPERIGDGLSQVEGLAVERHPMIEARIMGTENEVPVLLEAYRAMGPRFRYEANDNPRSSVGKSR